MKRTGLLLVAALAVVIYLPTLANGYVFDDVPIVRNNPVIRERRYVEAVTGPYWPDLEGVRGGSSNWRPLATLSFVLEDAVVGVSHPIVHHLVNALLHGLVVLALFPLARRFAGGAWPLAACALFAAHPAHTESVAPVVGRCDLLAALGVLLALEFFLEHRDGGPTARRSLWLAAAAFAVGLGGKESAAPLILLLPAADRLMRGTPLRSLAGRPALSYLPFVVVLAIYLAARLAVLGDASFEHAGAMTYGPAERLLFAARNAAVSAGLLLAPLRFHHMVTTLPDNAPYTYALPGGAAALAFAAGGVLLAFGWLALIRRAPRAAFLWLAALLTWAPTSGLLPAAAGVSMRFLLLPTAFAAIGAALALFRVEQWRPRWRTPLRAAVIAVIVAGAAVSVWRSTQWRDNRTFYLAVVSAEPDCFTAHYSLGSRFATQDAPDLERAREHLHEAARIAGDGPDAFNARMALAETYEMEGRAAEALAVYRDLLGTSLDDERAAMVRSRISRIAP